MAPRTRRGQRNNPSISRKGKQITPKQKLILYLNEAISIENIGVPKAAITDKADNNRKCKTATRASLGRDNGTTG